jgi:hypothetical protein
VGSLPEVDGRDGVDIGGRAGGLVGEVVTIAVFDMGVCGAGHIAGAGAGAGAGTVDARCTILGIEIVATWIVHEFAFAAIANVCGVVCLVVVAVAAAVVGDADVTADVARCLVLGAVVGAIVVTKVNLRLF